MIKAPSTQALNNFKNEATTDSLGNLLYCSPPKSLGLKQLLVDLWLQALIKHLFPSVFQVPLVHWNAAQSSFWNLLFSRQNNPNLFNLSLSEQCSNTLLFLVVLLCTCSNRSISVLYWQPQWSAILWYSLGAFA